MTGKEVRNFLDTYVAGSTSLPLEEVLSWVGIDFVPEMQTGDSTVSLGSIGLGLNEEQKLMVADNSHMNEFGKQMGYQNGDVLLAVNGQPISLIVFQQMLDKLNEEAVTGQPLTITVRRKVDGETKEVDLTAPILKLPVIGRNVLVEKEDATPQQIKLRNAWLSAE